MGKQQKGTSLTWPSGAEMKQGDGGPGLGAGKIKHIQQTLPQVEGRCVETRRGGLPSPLASKWGEDFPPHGQLQN